MLQSFSCKNKKSKLLLLFLLVTDLKKYRTVTNKDGMADNMSVLCKR